MAFQNASSRNRFFFLQQNALGLKPEGAVALSVQTPGRFREGSGRFRAGSGQVPSRFREGSGRVRELAAQVPRRVPEGSGKAPAGSNKNATYAVDLHGRRRRRAPRSCRFPSKTLLYVYDPRGMESVNAPAKLRTFNITF